MLVLLDENVDRRLKQRFNDSFDVITVAEHGWSGMKNGELLKAAEKEFDVFVTMDKGIKHQQNIQGRGIGIILILARSNRRQDVEPAMPKVNNALKTISNGELIEVIA